MASITFTVPETGGQTYTAYYSCGVNESGDVVVNFEDETDNALSASCDDKVSSGQTEQVTINFYWDGIWVVDATQEVTNYHTSGGDNGGQSTPKPDPTLTIIQYGTRGFLLRLAYSIGTSHSDAAWWIEDVSGAQVSDAVNVTLPKNGFSDTINVPISYFDTNTGTAIVKASVTVWNGSTSTTETSSATIYHYAPPDMVDEGAIEITSESGKLTPTKQWTLSWPATNGKYPHCPLLGYIVMLVDNSQGPIKPLYFTDESSKDIEEFKNGPPGYRVPPSVTSVTLDTSSCSIYRNKTYQLNVYTIYTSRSGMEDVNNYNEYGVSSRYTVVGDSVANVRLTSGWAEGEVYIRLDNDWKQADSLHLHTESGWVEVN